MNISKLLFCCMLCFNILLKSSYAIYLENNGYKDIVISFLPSITYNDVNFQNLKLMLLESSKRLLHATKRRVYFSEIILNVRSSWPNGFCEGLETVKHLNHDDDTIVIIKSKGLSSPLTQHSRGCGESGEVIYLPISWLYGDIDVMSRLFVQQWAFFRYGVFEESPISENSCYVDYTRWTWVPSGCYNVRTSSEMTLDSNGLPRCNFSGDSSAIRSSLLLSTDDLPNVTDFCDGSDTFPHSPINPTLHNNLCSGKPAWEVIKNTQDFKYGINSPLSEDVVEPQTTIKCHYQSESPSIFIAMQNSSAVDMTNLVTELRYVLLRFFLYDIPSDVKSSVMTFSNEVHEVINLNLQEPELLETVLKKHIRVTDAIENVCVICAMEAVVKIQDLRSDDDGIFVFIIFASSLETTNVEDFKKIIRTLTNKLHFVVLQDTTNDAIFQSIIPVIYDMKGQVFLIPTDRLVMSMKTSIALTSIVKSRGHVFVVHQARFVDIKADIVDEFTIDGDVEGQLLYMLKCNDSENDLIYDKTHCGSLPYLPDSAYTCGNHSVLKATNVSKTWQFNFDYLKDIKSLTCMSLATVKTSFGHQDSLVFRGWFSNNIIRPGENALIIYAEVLKDYMPIEHIEVVAYIYEPSADRPIVLQLRDNGNGDPDVKKGDGIYSRYFSKFLQKGAYSVLIQLNPTIGADNDPQDNSRFSRTVFVGTFLLKTIPTMDIYPPNRIADLQVVAVDHENSTVTLQWTAPGDDYDDGQAFSYDVFWKILSNQTYQASITMDLLIQPVSNQEIKPLPSGSKEIVIFQLLNSKNEAIYQVSITVMDKNQNKAKRSNVVEVYLKSPTNSTITFSTTPTPNTELISDPVENETNAIVATTDDDEWHTTTTIDGNETTRTETVTEVAINTTITSSNCDHLDSVVILASSIGGGILILIILINILVCVLCFRRNHRFRASTRPPHNVSIKLQSTNKSDSLDSLGDKFDTPSRDSNYDLHHAPLDEDPKNNLSAQNEKTRVPDTNKGYSDYREGYQVVTATPAYVNSNLNWQHSAADSQRMNSQSSDSLDTRVYPLGMV